MGKISVSVVITVFNEAGSIDLLLDSLNRQTLKPKEIIVVDAGSDDGTYEKAMLFEPSDGISFVWIEKPGCNRSVGRNVGIRQAQSEIIAVIDAGCRADKDWLKHLVSRFRSNVSSVAGFYQPVVNSVFEKAVSLYTCVLPEKLNIQTYLPSSRSLAFTKRVWEKVGGYPEHVSTCEDLLFAVKLKKTGHMAVEPKALVYWELPKTIPDYFSQIVGYASGDVEANYGPHLIRIASVWARYVILVWLWWLWILYIAWIIFKHGKQIDSALMGLWVIAIQLISDVAVMVGSVVGMKKRLFN